MKTPRFFCTLLFLAVAVTGAGAQTREAGRDVMGAGGGSSGNNRLGMQVTVGQSVAGDVIAPGMLLQQGFWHRIVKSNGPVNIPPTPGLSLAIHAQPNPFMETSELLVNVPTAGRVTAKLHDTRGAEVLTLVDEFHQAGVLAIPVDGTSLASGTYVVRLTTGGMRATATLHLVK